MKNQNIILIRHGESSHNVGEEGGFFAGSIFESTLTFKGKNETIELAKNLPLDKIDLIISSPMKRTIKTAQIIQKIIEEKTARKIPVIIEKELHEINVGKFTEHTAQEVKALFPKEAKYFYDSNFTRWNFPDGESYEEIIKRVKKAAKNIIRESRNMETVLVVGHAMFYQVMLNKLFGQNKLPRGQADGVFLPDKFVSNGLSSPQQATGYSAPGNNVFKHKTIIEIPVSDLDKIIK